MQTSQIVAYLDSTGALDTEVHTPWPGRRRADEVVEQLDTAPLLGPTTRGPDGGLPTIGAVLDELGGADAPDPPDALPTAQWDVDAWYQPVHTHAYDHGIHVRESAVIDLARRLAAGSHRSTAPLAATAENAQHLLRMSFVVLYLHQHFHHRVEMLGLRMQVVEQRPRYLAYYRVAYPRAAGTDDQLEESLANAYVHRMLTRRAHSSGVPPEVRRLVSEHVRRSWTHDEPGYRTAGSFLTSDAWAKGLGELHARMDEATVRPTRRATWRHLGPDLTGSFLDPATDVFVVRSTDSAVILPRGEAVPRACTPAQMVTVLEHGGYEQPRRAKGSQVRLTSKGRALAVVPSSAPLSPGATRRLLALVDATPAELPTLLGGT